MWTEIANEGMFLIICYHMVLFSNLIWAPHIKLYVGISLIVFLVSLLGGNTLFIAFVSVKGYKRNKRFKYIKKRHETIMDERTTALSVINSATFLNKTYNEKKRPDQFKSNRLVYTHERRRIEYETKESIHGIIKDKFKESKKEKYER